MSIPVVENEKHTWRNHIESLMEFHHVTPDQEHEYDYGKALDNREKLLRHMTFTKDYLPSNIRKLTRAFSQQ